MIGCLEIFQNGRSPQPITGIIYSPGPLELNIGSAVEDTLGFIPLVFCFEIIPTFPLSYWEANSYYPKGPILDKGNKAKSIFHC